MKKWYQTVVCGKPEKSSDTLVDYLLKDGKTNTSKVVKEGTPGSKRSELRYEVIQSDGEKTLLKIRLLTCLLYTSIEYMFVFIWMKVKMVQMDGGH